MNTVKDSAELAPTRNPSAYARRPVLSGVFWVMMAFCALCLLAAAAVVILGPKLAPVRKIAAVAPAAAPAPAPAQPQPAQVAPAAPVAASDLTARVQRLETGQTRIVDAAAGALAAASLSDAASGPGPFGADLAAVARLLPGSPDALALAPLAQEGAPTRAALAAELTDIGGQVAAAARTPGIDQAAYAFSRVVTIRRIDGGASGADAALARAERAAEDGDLEHAVSALDALPDATKSVLAPWRDRAERRMEIDRRIAAIRSQAMANLAAAQSGGTSGGAS